jgi:hypothetical protein
MFVYSKEHKAFLVDATKRVDMTGVAQQFNAHFGLNKTERQLRGIMQKNKIAVVTRKIIKKKFQLTDEQALWIKQRYKAETIAELRAGFISKFGGSYTHHQFANILHNLGFKSKGGFKTKGKFKFQLSDAQVSWLKEEYQIYTAAILLNMFNKKYARSLTMEQFKNVLAKHEIKSETKFTDKVGYEVNRTAFKKGGIHPTAVSVGSELIEGGYTRVKVAEPNVWKSKHVIVYEKHFGPVKSGEVIRFKDGNKDNFSPENLFKTTRRGHGFLFKFQLLSQPKPAQESLLLLTQVRDKNDEIKKLIGDD